MIATFIQNPIKVAVAVILVALFGIIAIFRMPMQLTPEVNTPTITIETRWPGASPQEVEREIVQEQEEQLKSVEGLVKLSSECMDSVGRITLEFRVGADMEETLVKVNAKLQQVREYPEDADEPIIETANSADRPIAWFVIGAKLPGEDQIQKYRAAHPELAAELDHAMSPQNIGVKMLRLRELVKRCELLRDLLPVGVDPATVARARVEELGAKYPLVAADLEPALQSQDLAGGLRALLPLADNYPEISLLLPKQVNLEELRKFVEDNVETRFERVDGVSNANVFGGREPEMQVVVDPEKLALRKLTIEHVRQALRGLNQDTSAGDFWELKRRYVVRTLGQFKSIEDVATQVLDIQNGQPVFVGDVAEVRLGYKKPDGLVRRYGTSGLAVNCIRETGANVLDVMKGLKKTMTELNEQVLFPMDLEMSQVYDETEYIYAAVDMVNSNIISGGILTVIVLLLFLRSGRSTLVIGLAIPTSIVGTFLLLNMMGRSLNVISLAGLAFAVGMLVDNAIVVLENIYRHYQNGDSPTTATIKGTEEVWGAIAASTLTTLAVFLPVVLIQEEAGQLFLDISLAISCAVGLSMIVAMTVVPVAASILFEEPTEEEKAAGVAAGASTFWGATLQRILTPLDYFADRFMAMISGTNEWLMANTLRRAAVVVLFVAGSAAATWLLWPKVEYLPNGNRNLVFGLVLPPSGYNMNQMIDLGEMVENDARKYWDVDGGVTKVEDTPAIGDFFFVARGRQVFVGVRAVDPTKAGRLVPIIRQIGSRLPGTITVASQSSLFAQGLQAGRTIDIEITGPELERLVQLGGQVLGQVGTPEILGPKSQARPIPSLDLSTPEIHVRAKRLQSAESRVDNLVLGYAVNALVDGAYAGDYYLDGDKIDLVIVGEARFLNHSQDLATLPIATPDGQLVQLGALADVELSSGPEQVNRRERQRAITIQVTPPEEMPLEEAIARINESIVRPLQASGQLDGGYRVTLAGTADKLRDTWTALSGNVLLAGLITYLLMAALFESWLYPLVIILAVPLGAVGGVIFLWLLGLYLQLFGDVPQALDVITMLGFVILIGTVVNNPILIVDQSLVYMRTEGMNYLDAIVETVRTRVRPIFMTTVTTVLGLAPLVLFPGAGSELYRGLGAVVLGGLLISTILTLVLVPSLFSLFIELFDRSLIAQTGRRKSELEAEALSAGTAAVEPRREVFLHVASGTIADEELAEGNGHAADFHARGAADHENGIDDDASPDAAPRRALPK